MNHSPYTVNVDMSAENVYRLFRLVALRHLVVINNDGEAVGIITRKNLAIVHHEEVKRVSLKSIEWILSKALLNWREVPHEQSQRHGEWDGCPTFKSISGCSTGDISAYKRGFFCDDLAIKYPLLDNTISIVECFIIWVCYCYCHNPHSGMATSLPLHDKSSQNWKNPLDIY
ncbi:CLCN7 [Lepeophtheirus salmonis]|uniref:CLCN7 n=1 Tax=Lepeophtheirus salmonis TaxID=72036 RepID=A0A7R8D3W0_LEPSM|nr:CLCN7 [Lepeophtheirus salmonis]CAF3020302.1 CLCN7 [Lepeophtheirus salmonis]